MKFDIKKQQLNNIFDSLMKEYENLDFTDKSYDYWDSLKGRYVDDNVINYYEDINEDYEYDNWIFQYQMKPGDSATKYEVPILRYSSYFFQNIESMVQDHFSDLLKEWFKKKYGYYVNKVQKY